MPPLVDASGGTGGRYPYYTTPKTGQPVPPPDSRRDRRYAEELSARTLHRLLILGGVSALFLAVALFAYWLAPPQGLVVAILIIVLSIVGPVLLLAGWMIRRTSQVPRRDPRSPLPPPP